MECPATDCTAVAAKMSKRDASVCGNGHLVDGIDIHKARTSGEPLRVPVQSEFRLAWDNRCQEYIVTRQSWVVA